MTCLVTRAVHVELVKSLSAEDLLLGMRAAFAIHTIPKVIISDNGTNFKRVSKALMALRDACDQELYAIKWQFSVPAAPWRGGVFERVIGTFKRAFKCLIFRKRQIGLSELRVIMLELCAVLNTRPLVVADGQIVTPNHFSARKQLPYVTRTEANHVKSDELAKLYVSSQRRLNSFWSTWFPLYLLELKHAMSTPDSTSLLAPGTTVLVDKVGGNRSDWPLATIERAIPGPDGVTRTYEVRFSNQKLALKPVQRLISLEGTWS